MLMCFFFFSESYTQAVNNPVTPSLRALKTQTPPSPSNRKRHGIRASFGKGLMKLRGHKSSSEPSLGMGCLMYSNFWCYTVVQQTWFFFSLEGSICPSFQGEITRTLCILTNLFKNSFTINCLHETHRSFGLKNSIFHL